MAKKTTEKRAGDANIAASVARDIIVKHLNKFQSLEDPQGGLSEVVHAVANELNQLRQTVADASMFQQDVAQSLVHTLHCVVASDINNDSSKNSAVGPEGSILELIAAITCSCDDTEVAKAVLARAAQFGGALLERVRVLAAQFVGMMVKHLMARDTQSILLDTASQTLLPRFTDKSQAVRFAAIAVANFFFAPLVDDPDIAQALQWSLQHDPSVNNREAAVRALPLTAQTMDAVLGRMRDVKAKVRVQAVQALQFLPWGAWTADDCAVLIDMGLTERCELTKAATVKLVCESWFKAAEYDLLELMSKIDMDLHETTCEMVVSVLFDAPLDSLTSLSESERDAFDKGLQPTSFCIPKDNSEVLDTRRVFVARVFCQHIAKSNNKTPAEKAAALQDVAPDIAVLCDLVDRSAVNLVNMLKSEADDGSIAQVACACLQLLKLAAQVDMEEGSRRHFVNQLKGMLGSILLPDDLVEGCLEALNAKCTRNVFEFTDTVNDIISNLLSDASNDDAAQQELELNYKLRTLSTMAFVLERLPPVLLHNDVVEKSAAYIQSAMDHDEPMVKEAAVACFGKLGLLTPDTNTLQSNFFGPLLEIVCNSAEDETVRAQAMLAMADWNVLLVNNDPNARSPSPQDSDGFVGVIEALVSGQAENPLLRNIASEIACKLIGTGAVESSRWLGHLIVTFFNFDEHTEIEGDLDCHEIGSPFRLHQLLSVFFPSFCSKGSRSRQLLLSSVGDVLNIVRELVAENRKPCDNKQWPLAIMLDYIFVTVEDAPSSDHAQPDNQENSSPAACSSTEIIIATAVAKFLSSCYEELGTTYSRAICKFLGTINVETGGQPLASVNALATVMEEIGQEITDASCLRSLQRLNETLASYETLHSEKRNTQLAEYSLVAPTERGTLNENHCAPVNADEAAKGEVLLRGGTSDVESSKGTPTRSGLKNVTTNAMSVS